MKARSHESSRPACVALLLALAGFIVGHARPAEPSPGVVLAADVRASLQVEADRLGREVQALMTAPGGAPALLPDVAVLWKAVDGALRLDGFQHTNEVSEARRVLDLGLDRARQLREGRADWLVQTGLVVRGFRSAVDRSFQPYGVVVGPAYRRGGRMDVWLHGRDEQLTEMRFLRERMRSAGEFAPSNAVVVHPYGRYCNAFKFAGETDVMEAMEHATAAYGADPARRSIRGFSMGGAGTWHLAAHHPGLWRAAAPGAGFAETARYIGKDANDPRITPWERVLWGWYDATAAAANFRQVPTIAYSGEQDRQIQAARVMEEALRAEGLQLMHLVGPNTQHRYEPATKKELAARIDALMDGPPLEFRELELVTRTLRHPAGEGAAWLRFEGLERHWSEARLKARVAGPNRVEVFTAGVTRFSGRLPPGVTAGNVEWVIDGSMACVEMAPGEAVTFACAGRGTARSWKPVGASEAARPRRAKKPGLQGPIDDAFMAPFLVVTPTGRSRSPAVQAWTEASLARFIRDWRFQFRGEAPCVRDVDVTADQLARFHVVAWGDPDSNALLRRAMARERTMRWTRSRVVFGGVRLDAAVHVPSFVLPNPLAPDRYLVANSGPTFADWVGTNARQTPRLPDWAVWDVAAGGGGKVVKAGFFDEAWRVVDDGGAP
ncbi:MAG: prolyl oligopeptidase family serine peptidase [Verrucomicrobiota bacterium]